MLDLLTLSLGDVITDPVMAVPVGIVTLLAYGAAKELRGPRVAPKEPESSSPADVHNADVSNTAGSN